MFSLKKMKQQHIVYWWIHRNETLEKKTCSENMEPFIGPDWVGYQPHPDRKPLWRLTESYCIPCEVLSDHLGNPSMFLAAPDCTVSLVKTLGPVCACIARGHWATMRPIGQHSQIRLVRPLWCDRKSCPCVLISV